MADDVEGVLVTSVVVDPRLRQRRIDVDRAHGRRRLRRAGGVGVVAAVVLGAVGIVFSPLLDVDRIEVAGASRTSVGAILDAGSLTLGEPLVRLDVDRAGAGIGELPWVAEVTVERSWNGVVSIVVVERRPVGIIERGTTNGEPGTEQDADHLLVDAEGQILAVSANPPPGVPALSTSIVDLQPGEQVEPELLPMLIVAGRAPAATGLAPGVFSVDRGDVVWSVDGVGRFRFGSAVDLDEKLIALSTVLEELGGVVGGELDLRVPATVVRRVDGLTPPTIDRDGLDIP